MMADQAAEVKKKDVIIIPSPRFSLRSFEGGSVSGAGGDCLCHI